MKWSLSVIVLVSAVTGYADDSWKGPVGVEADWNVGANWNSGSVPDAEIAFVDNGGIAVMPSGTIFNNGTVAISQGSSSSTVKIEPGASLSNTKILVSNAGSGRGLLLINGGSIDTSTKDFVMAQNSTTATGVVVMTGGEVKAKNFYVGYNGSGFFTLSNGLFRTTVAGYVGLSLLGEFVQEGGTNSYDSGADLYLARYGSSRGEYTLNGGTLLCSDFMYLGYASQAEGVLTINGGRMVNSNNVVIGAASGGNGTMTVNGGNGNWQHLGSVLRVGYGTGSTGTLTMNGHTNSFNSVDVGDNSGSTGCVTMTGCDITVASGIALSGAAGSLVQNGGDLTITSGGLEINSTSGAVVQNGGDLEVTAGGLTVSGTDAGLFTANSNAVLSANSVYVGATGRIELHDAKLAVTNASVSASATVAAGGGIELDGGIIMLDNLELSSGGAGDYPPCVDIRDGLFLGRKRTTAYGGAPFVQSGGIISNTEFYVYGQTNRIARFEFSGGRFNLAPPNNFALFTGDSTEVCVKGSASDLSFNRFSYVGGVVKPFLLQFILDRSPVHVAPIRFTGSDGYECGHLRAGLDGGVLLTRTNTFALLTGVKSSNFGFLSHPDTSMWDVARIDEESRITLAVGGSKGSLDMSGTKAAGPFTAVPMGHVDIANIRTNRLIELNVRMALTAGAKSVAQVVADMVEAGYTNAVEEAEGGYNVKLVISAEDVVDRAVAPLSWFTWDFTETEGIQTVGSVVTNAMVTALALEAVKLPEPGTIIVVY